MPHPDPQPDPLTDPQPDQTTPLGSPGLRPETRLCVFYASLFMPAGIVAVFAGIWFAALGLTTDQIAALNTVPILIVMILNMVVGRIADRASDWRKVIVWGAVVAGLCPLGLFVVDGFWGILLFWSLTSIAQSLIVPVTDAAAMRLTQRRGSDFGAVRAWGTMGYLGVIFVSGYALVWFGGTIFVPVLVALGLMRAAAALGLPLLRAPQGLRKPTPGATRLRQVLRPWFLLPLVGWAMVFSTHLILNAFQGLLFQRQGIPVDTIGLLIATGALSEAAMFFVFRRWFSHIAPRRLILLSAGVSVMRWCVMGLSPGVPVLFALQSLHAITFAAGFLGCMAFITKWTSEDIAAEAQGLFNTLQQAMSILALSAFGWLAGHWGAQAYFASAAFAALGGALALLSYRLHPGGNRPLAPTLKPS